MVRQTFDCCNCGAGIVFRLWHCGKRKTCPACKVEFEVPTPPAEVAVEMLMDIDVPHPLPGETLLGYADLHKRLVRIADVVYRSCERCGYPEAALPIIDDVVRSLGSVAQFALHVMESNAQTNDGPGCVSDALSQMIAGSDIGGIGISKEIRAQNDYWEATETTKPDPLPDSDLLEAIADSIRRLKTLMDQ